MMESYKRFVETFKGLVDLHENDKLKKAVKEETYKRSILFVKDIFINLLSDEVPCPNCNHDSTVPHTCKVFEVDDDIKRILLLTDAPKDEVDVKLPFPSMFIEVSFSRAELDEFCKRSKQEAVYGILVRKGELLATVSKRKLGTGLRLSTCSDKQMDGGLYRNISTFNLGADETKEPVFVYNENHEVVTTEVVAIDKHTEKFLDNFVRCFIHFLNNPEVKQVECVRSEKNVKRKQKQGKMPLPSSTVIHVNGYLKEYIDKLKSGGHFSYHCRFWVRGFQRVLKAARYKENIGKVIFVQPFIKGSGVFINKGYDVEFHK